MAGTLSTVIIYVSFTHNSANKVQQSHFVCNCIVYAGQTCRVLNRRACTRGGDLSEHVHKHVPSLETFCRVCHALVLASGKLQEMQDEEFVR